MKKFYPESVASFNTILFSVPNDNQIFDLVQNYLDFRNAKLIWKYVEEFRDFKNVLNFRHQELEVTDSYRYFGVENCISELKNGNHAPLLAEMTRLCQDEQFKLFVWIYVKNFRAVCGKSSNRTMYLKPLEESVFADDGYIVKISHPNTENPIHHKYMLSVIEFLMDSKISVFKSPN